MTTKKRYARASGVGLALAFGIAFSSNAFAQQTYRAWVPTPAPITQYYSYHYAQPACPGGACGANNGQHPSCPNGSCAARTWTPTPTPVESLRNGVQRVFSPVLPMPQSPSQRMPVTVPSATRESPYYDYQTTATRPAAPSRPAQIAPTNNDSPYYP